MNLPYFTFVSQSPIRALFLFICHSLRAFRLSFSNFDRNLSTKWNGYWGVNQQTISSQIQCDNFRKLWRNSTRNAIIDQCLPGWHAHVWAAHRQNDLRANEITQFVAKISVWIKNGMQFLFTDYILWMSVYVFISWTQPIPISRWVISAGHIHVARSTRWGN